MTDADLRETLAAWFKDSGTNDTMAARGAVYGVTIVPADDSESKRDRARRSLAPLSRQRLAKLARDIGRAQGAFGLEDQGLRILEESLRPITEITRRDIARCFGDDLSGKRDVVEMVRPLFPLSSSLDMLFASTRTLADEIHQHMTLNPGDWSVEHLFDQIGALDCPIDRFGRLLEAALHPLARRGPEQTTLISALNTVLARDGYGLDAVDEESGFPIFRLVPLSKGVTGAAKNLIFASIGPKPEIGFRDAINNDIVILHNADSCLVYDRKIPREGVRWSDLVNWWGQVSQTADSAVSAKTLGERLHRSLASDGEKNLFNTYFKRYRKSLGDALPALIPQVYLHYDPAVVKQLRHRDGLFRQRMDFLILLPQAQRVVLEVDGSQHFSADGKPSLDLYGQMVAADRELRLVGYEVYRFGAKELVGPGAETVIATFFDGLLRRHGLQPSPDWER